MSSLERVVIWLHIRRPYLTLTSLIFRVSEGRSAVIHHTIHKFLARMVIPTQESREIDIALFGSISWLQGPLGRWCETCRGNTCACAFLVYTGMFGMSCVYFGFWCCDDE